MAISLLKLLGNAKTRTLVLLTAGVLCCGIIIAIASSKKTGEPLEDHPSKTAQIPKGVESTPGAKTSEKYRELQEKANTIGAEKAEKKGGTFIPTIVADNKAKKNNEDLQSQFLKALEQTDPAKIAKDPSKNGADYLLATKDPKLAQIIAQQKQDDANAEAINKQRQAQLNAEKNAERMAALNEQRLKAIETVAQAMEEQTKNSFNAWNEIPVQGYIEGALTEGKDTKANADDTKSSSKIDKRPVILKAGTILFGVLETAVNSDEPGPIMAKIIQPPFKDALLVGTIQGPQDSNGEKVTLRFETMNIPTEPMSNKISAVAIDPDTARTALASDVDHHYLLRWGTVFGSSFLTGYAKAVARSGTTVTNTNVPGQSMTQTNTPNLSGKQQIFEGLGDFGAKISDQMGQQFSRKNTITIDSGTGIGILVLADVKLGPEPQQTQQEQQPQAANNATQQKPGNAMDLLANIMQNAGQGNINNQQQAAGNVNANNQQQAGAGLGNANQQQPGKVMPAVGNN